MQEEAARGNRVAGERGPRALQYAPRGFRLLQRRQAAARHMMSKIKDAKRKLWRIAM